MKNFQYVGRIVETESCTEECFTVTQYDHSGRHECLCGARQRNIEKALAQRNTIVGS
jgi:hypothetical protein